MIRLSSIQRLRAVAALSVTLFHACQWSGQDFAVGAAGVDLFFIISGFVLWNASEGRAVSPGRFLIARAARVAPLYWLATLAVAVLVPWRPQAMPVAQFEPLHLVLSLLFIPHNDPAGDAFPLLVSGWTLTYEAFFYLAFALALAAPLQRRLQVLCGLVSVMALVGLIYHQTYTFGANPLLLEFLIGVGLARLWSKGDLRGAGAGWGWVILGLGVLMFAGLQLGSVRSDFWRPLIWAPPAALILAGALVLEAAGASGPDRVGRPLDAIGDASYSLYICQLPVVCVLKWLTPELSPWIRVPLGFALALGAGLICYRLIERPLASALGRHRRARTLHRHGLGLRPPEQEALAAVDADLA